LVVASAAGAGAEAAVEDAEGAASAAFFDFDDFLLDVVAAAVAEESAGADASAAAFLDFFDFLVGVEVDASLGEELCVWAKPKLAQSRIRMQNDRVRIDFRLSLFTEDSPRLEFMFTGLHVLPNWRKYS